MIQNLKKHNRIIKVITEIIKNIEPTLADKIYSNLMNINEINNQRSIEKYIYNFLELKSCNIHSYNYWLNRGWKDTEIDKLRPILKTEHSPMLVSNWLKKINPLTNNFYNKDEATLKIKSQRKQNIEYWQNKINTLTNNYYTYDEAIICVSEYQKEQSLKFANKLKNNPDNYKNRTQTQIQYWIDRTSNIDEAKEKLYNRQSTSTLEKFTALYGEDDGVLRYNKKSKALAYANTLEYYINRFGETDGYEKYINKVTSNKKNKKYKSSKEAYYFFIEIYKFLRINNIKKDEIYWGVGKSKEFFLHDKKNKYLFFYDFTIPKINLIIEFNGIAFHPNPNWSLNKLENWKQAFTKKNYKEILDKQYYKENVAKDLGFKIISVFSDDNKEISKKNIIKEIQLLLNK